VQACLAHRRVAHRPTAGALACVGTPGRRVRAGATTRCATVGAARDAPVRAGLAFCNRFWHV